MSNRKAIDDFNRECERIRREINAETTDFQRYAKLYKDAIDRYINATGQRPPPYPQKDESRSNYRIYNLKWIGDALNKIAENIERKKRREEENRNRTREQWAAIEREFIRIERGRDALKSDYFGKLVGGEITQEEYDEILDQARECAAWNCGNWFVPGRERRADAKYCSDECAQEQRDAAKRFKRSGTFLPVKAYEPNREETENRKYWRELKTTLCADPDAARALDLDKRRKRNRQAANASKDGSGKGHKINVRLNEKGESGPVKTYTVNELPDGHPLKPKTNNESCPDCANKPGKNPVKGEGKGDPAQESFFICP